LKLPTSICNGEKKSLEFLEDDFIVIGYDTGKFGINNYVDTLCLYRMIQDPFKESRVYLSRPYTASIDFNRNKLVEPNEIYDLELEDLKLENLKKEEKEIVQYSGREFKI